MISHCNNGVIAIELEELQLQKIMVLSKPYKTH
jgi:hypothetical protein